MKIKKLRNEDAKIYLFLFMLMGLGIFVLIFFEGSITGLVIFGDSDEGGFESGNLNNWILTHTGTAEDWNISTMDSYSGSYHAQSNPQDAGENSSMEKTMNTSGYENVNFSYYRKLVGLDTVDWFRVKWYDGTTWTTLEEQNSENGEYIYKEFFLPSSADDNPDFRIKFECVAGAVSEYCRIDNINVDGDLIDNIPPLIDVVYPLDTTYNSNISELNYTSNEEGYCWYSINNGATNSSSVLSGINFMNVVSSEGSNTWIIYCNDTNGNENSSSVTFVKDIVVDSFSPQIFFSPLTIESGEYNQDSIFVGVEVSDDSQTYSFINFNNSLNAFYKLNETGSTIKDYSGNSYDGTISGATSIAGKFGDGLYFDGEDTVDCAGAGNFERTDKFSVSVWVKSEPDEAGIIQRYDGTKGWSLFTTADGTLVFDMMHDDANYIRRRSSNTVSDTTWNHIVFTYDGSSTLAGTHVYIDGQLDDSSSGNLDNLSDSISTGLNCKIGILHNYSNYRWIGDIDEVFIFNRVLSLDEISALYNSSSYLNNFTNLIDGSYDFYTYSQDTSGNENQTATRTVNLVSNVVPLVSLVEPQNILYSSNESLALDFIASDSDGNLDSCWYNLDDGENITLVNCANITFSVSANGSYILTIYANDSDGLESSDDVNFKVDVTGVSVSISEPSGIKVSRAGIPIEYSVTGDNLNCWYNVKTSIGGGIIANTSLANCSGSSFNVSADGDYLCRVYVNNTLGSFNLDTSSFSVDTLIVPPIVPSADGSSGGGGGGSVSSGGALSARLESEGGSAIIFIGEDKSLLISVKNTGRVSANKCRLVGGDYVDSNDILNIGVGEIVEFMFVLSALDEGVSDFNLSIECLDDVAEDVPLDVVVLRSELDVSIDGIFFGEDGKLLVSYSVEAVDDLEQVLMFRIMNQAGEVIAESLEEVSLVYGEVYEGKVSVDISDADEGMLRVVISDESSKDDPASPDNVIYVEEEFVYGGGSRLTGFVALDWDSTFSYIGIMILGFLVLVGFLVRRIWKLKNG